MLDLSQEQIRAVVSMYLMGISHFDADHPQADALGQLFCFAAREVLEEEKVGSGKPRSEILADIARQARPQVLPETYEAFCSLQEDEFDRLLQPVLDETEESGVSRAELLAALSSINEVIDYFLQSPPPDASFSDEPDS